MKIHQQEYLWLVIAALLVAISISRLLVGFGVLPSSHAQQIPPQATHTPASSILPSHSSSPSPSVQISPTPSPGMEVSPSPSMATFLPSPSIQPGDIQIPDRSADGFLPERIDGQKTIYLTFDDGPYPSVTLKILEVLKRHEVKGTFFMLGELVDRYPDIVKQAYQEGHAIGHHSYNHRKNEVYASNDSFVEQLIQTEEALEKATGRRHFGLYRYPGGRYDGKGLPFTQLLAARGYTAYRWNAVTDDASGKNPTVDQMVESAKMTAYDKQSIVLLMHDGEGKTLTPLALDKIIAYYKQEGYVFKTLDMLY